MVTGSVGSSPRDTYREATGAIGAPTPCTLPVIQPLLSPQESETLSVSGMESFIEKQAKLLEVQPADAPGRDSEQTAEGCVDGHVSDAAAPAQGLSSSDPGE